MFKERDVQQQFKMEMDTEKLISEVEMRPCIWNPSCDEYKNRDLRIKAWNDICENMILHFVEWTARQVILFLLVQIIVLQHS